MTEISYFLCKLLAEINLGKFTGKSTTVFLGITIAVNYITVSSAYIRIWHRSIGRSLKNRTKRKGPRIDP